MNVFWVKILSQFEVDKLDKFFSPRQMLSCCLPTIFEPEDLIWLSVHGSGKCEIIATSVDGEFVKTRPKRLVVNVPEIRMS